MFLPFLSSESDHNNEIAKQSKILSRFNNNDLQQLGKQEEISLPGIPPREEKR
jgi:hypothetical protein